MGTMSHDRYPGEASSRRQQQVLGRGTLLESPSVLGPKAKLNGANGHPTATLREVKSEIAGSEFNTARLPVLDR